MLTFSKVICLAACRPRIRYSAILNFLIYVNFTVTKRTIIVNLDGLYIAEYVAIYRQLLEATRIKSYFIKSRVVLNKVL